ncbi:MAG: TlyA family RNA methyltransferase, partial [Myxococcota bacterium]|nr:TlyA family RNA methyltransferase [Myxococcota bacterium]
MSAKERLDTLVVLRGLAPTRNKAQALIRAGQVLVGEEVSDKPGTRLADDLPIRLRGIPMRFVSRGGLKLEAALVHFGVNPKGLLCADLGASTGGFTDCLLQFGAQRVHAVDVGYGQLAWTLRQDSRVQVLERTNARHLVAPDAPDDTGPRLSELVELVVGDLSFISLTHVLPAILRISGPGSQAVLLVKPQFEASKNQVGKGGVVRDPEVRQAAIDRVCQACAELGATVLGTMSSPVAGAKGG